MKSKVKITCFIVIGILALFGVRILTQIQYVYADDNSSYAQGYAKGCDDGKEDHDHKVSAKYHYNAKTANLNYIAGYEMGYYFGYAGMYSSYCEGDPMCTFTHMC
jgi:hypothetical protein